MLGRLTRCMAGLTRNQIIQATTVHVMCGSVHVVQTLQLLKDVPQQPL